MGFFLSNLSFFSLPVRASLVGVRRFSDVNSRINFVPPLENNAKIVLPISMGPYAQERRANKYSQSIEGILSATGDMLSSGKVASVDVICTAGLHHMYWPKEKIETIENFFFERHQEQLERQSAVYTWDNWLGAVGHQKYEESLSAVEAASLPNSEWYKLMVRTYRSTKDHKGLEKSLQYQREEYAAISLMSQYSNIVYFGQISPAWSYLYQIFQEKGIAAFTKAHINEMTIPKKTINMGDANIAAKLVIGMAHTVLSDRGLSDKSKHEIAANLISLCRTYTPSTLDTGDVQVDGTVGPGCKR